MNNEELYFTIEEIKVAHKFVLTKNGKCDYSSGRKTFGLVFIKSGQMEYHFKNKIKTLKNGDLAFFTPDSKYYITIDKDCEHYTVNFMLGKYSKNILKSNINVINTNKITYYDNLFFNISSNWHIKNNGYKLKCSSILYELLYSFFTESESNKSPDKTYAKILPAKEYLENHYMNDINLNELASLCTLSVSHFRHLFFEALKETPIQYRDKIRLLYAKDYLSSKYYTIEEISYLCGFKDANYFSRFFKKHTGISPKKY